MPSERQLAEAFGVGRSAMREAIKALSLIGLVEVRQGDGTYLRKADSALLPEVIEWGLLLGERRTMDLVEARQEIEIVIAGLAARRRTEQDIEDLTQILRADGAGHGAAIVRRGGRAVPYAAGGGVRQSGVARYSFERAGAAAHLDQPGAGGADGSREPSYLEHVPILAAIVDGNPEAAQKAMEAHMSLGGGTVAGVAGGGESGRSWELGVRSWYGRWTMSTVR